MKARWWRDLYIVLVLLLAACACAAIVYQAPARIPLDLAERTTASYIEGFYDAETSGPLAFRWSKGQSQIHFPGVGRDRPLLLQLEIAGWPGSAEQRPVATVTVDGAVLGTMAAGPIEAGKENPYSYTFLVPPRYSAGGDLDVGLESPTFSPGGQDTRQLGIAVVRATVIYRQGVGMPPLLPALALLVITLVAYISTRLAGWGEGVAVALAGGLLFPLTTVLALARLLVAPYLPALAGGIVILGLFVLVARLVAPGKDMPLPKVFAVLALFAPLPLWWRMLLVLPSTQPAGLAAILENLKQLPLALFLPPLPARDLVPIRTTLLAVILYLVVLLLQRLKKEGWRGWLSADGFLAVVVLVFAIVYLTLFLKEKGLVGDAVTDFTALYEGANRFFTAKGPLYNMEGILRNHFGPVYKYPPFFALLLYPLAFMPAVSALHVWQGTNLVLVVVGALLIAWMYRFERNAWLWAGLGFILFSWRAIYDTVGYGQTDIILFVLMVGALAALRKERGVLAGFLLALATMLKLYPAFLVLFLVLRREWRALAAFVVSMVVLAGLSVALLGWPVHATFLFEVLPRTGGGTAWVENQTLNGFFNRLTTERIALLPLTDRRADIAALLVAAVLTLAAGWLVYRLPGRKAVAYDLGFALLMTTMLLALPAAWVHYETILVLPFVLVFVYARERRVVPYRAGIVMALSFGLLCFGNAWLFFNREDYGRFWQLFLSYKLYGIVLLWIGLAVLMILDARATAGLEALPALPGQEGRPEAPPG